MEHSRFTNSVHYKSWILVALHNSLKLTILTCSTIRFSSYDVTFSHIYGNCHRCSAAFFHPLKHYVEVQMKVKIKIFCLSSFSRNLKVYGARGSRGLQLLAGHARRRHGSFRFCLMLKTARISNKRFF